jgi:hypothetical protein
MTTPFPTPWHADKTPGGYVVRDANGQALVYVYARNSEPEVMQAKVLTADEARRIAINVAKLARTVEARGVPPNLRVWPFPQAIGQRFFAGPYGSHQLYTLHLTVAGPDFRLLRGRPLLTEETCSISESNVWQRLARVKRLCHHLIMGHSI